MNKLESTAGAELAVRELIDETKALRDFARLSADWFWIQDSEFRYVRFLGSAFPRPDSERTRYLGTRRWEIAVGGIAAAGMAEHVAACMRHEEFRDFEYDLALPDGGTRRYSVSGAPTYNDDGDFAGYRGVGRDITALHQSRLAILAHEARLASIVDSNPLPTFVIDAGHRVTHWNEACAALTGIPASEVVGTGDCWKGFFDAPRQTLANLLLDGADDAALRDRYSGHIRRSTLIPGAIEAEAGFTRGGRERWLQLTAAPLRGADGLVQGAVEILQDVTEQRGAAARLAQAVDRYAEIFDNTLIGICYIRDRVIERCNRRMEEIFGWRGGELAGQSTRVLFASDDEWSDAGRRIHAGGDRFEGEIRYARKDGTPLRVHVVGKRKGSATEGFWVWSYEDVTAESLEREAGERMFREQRMIFEQAGTGIMFARDRVILRCNPAFGTIFGWPSAELIGRSTRVIFPSDEEWRAAAEVAGPMMATIGHWSGELEYVNRLGEKIWCRVKGNVLNPDDPSEGAVWLFDDITAQREAEDELRRTNLALEARVGERTAELSRQLNFMQQLLEAIPGPLYYKDIQGRYLGCNQAFAEFVGHGRDALVGCTVSDIVTPETAKRLLADDREMYLAGTTRISESRVTSNDGKVMDVMFHKAPFRAGDGEVAGLIGVMLDISDRAALEERLRQWATVFNSTADAVVIADRGQRVVAVNRAFTRITGLGEDDVIGREYAFLHSRAHEAAFLADIFETAGRVGFWRGEVWYSRKDGTEVAGWLTISAVTDRSGAVAQYVAVFSDITALKQIQARLDFQAHHDPLTELPNRLLLEDRIAGAIARARRESTQVAVLFVDLDRFKNVNDTLGHEVGDKVLIEVARRLKAVVREADTVARHGGDEFVILLEEVNGPLAASQVAEKIVDCLASSIVCAGKEFFVGASIGISLFPQDGDGGPTLLRNADAAMYRAKQRGRNTFEYFTADLSARALERFQLEVDVRHALERQELLPYFQAQFSLHQGHLVGAEALLRWQRPDGSLVPPGKFIPLAEETGLIVPIGEWMLRACCRQWAEWIADGLDPGLLSVNVSGVEFRRGRVADSVRTALAESGLPPLRLSIEVTEGAIMAQGDASVRELHELLALGVRIAIDDFGTGYSSLAYLKRLPVDTLKIDQSFVRGLPEDGEDVAISRAVIALARSLQLTTVAEGVETEAQAEFLRQAGCDEMQGYLKARPLPAEAFAATCLGRRTGPAAPAG